MTDVLTRVRLKGFKLSIDDFGTGYSSFTQLQRLPFSEIKIDRSFVIQMMKNKDCRTIAEIIAHLARKLELKSVAEGVEDQATFNELAVLGCDRAQGYHLSRPVAADRMPGLVQQRQKLNNAGPVGPGAGKREWLLSTGVSHDR